MTDSLANVVIPYARFVECQERRRRIAAELTLQTPPPAIEAALVPVPADRACPLDASTHLHGGANVDRS